MLRLLLLYLACWTLFLGCDNYSPLRELPNTVTGLAPLYADETFDSLQVRPPRSVVRLGRVAIHNDWLLLAEQGEGIHVVDNQNPQVPQKLIFLAVPGLLDFSVKDSRLYTNSGNDLLVIDIDDLMVPVLLTRLADSFLDFHVDFPQHYQGFFECPDPGRGTPVAWIETTLEQPRCWQ